MILKGFKKTYANFVLEINDLNLDKGKIYAIIGPNGSGKSTLAKCIASIINNDNNIKITTVNCAYLPQKVYSFNMTLKKNILLNSKDSNKVNEFINKLDLIQVEGQNAKTLSVGQIAKMSLSRILAKDYDLVILDEPTASMDMKSTLLAEEIIKSYVDNDKTMILITHSIPQAKRLADVTIYMENGLIEEMDNTKKLLSNPANPKTKVFLEF